MKPRTQAVRRSLNDKFYGFGTDGVFSWAKFVAVWSQIALLFHFGKSFEVLIEKPDTLAIILVMLILPDVAKKVISMKYGK